MRQPVDGKLLLGGCLHRRFRFADADGGLIEALEALDRHAIVGFPELLDCGVPDGHERGAILSCGRRVEKKADIVSRLPLGGLCDLDGFPDVHDAIAEFLLGKGGIRIKGIRALAPSGEIHDRPIGLVVELDRGRLVGPWH